MLSTAFRILLLVATSYIAALPTQQHERQSPHYTRLVVFGDSYSDNGSGARVVSNNTWPADPAYYSHSFSNGPVWASTLANTLGAQLLDYAVGGATADNDFVAGYTGHHSTIEVPSAHDQVRRFLNDSSPQDGDVFVHWIGANDALTTTNITGAEVTSLIARDVDLLYRAGAKTVLLANYLPINLFPATYNSSDVALANFAEAYAKSLDTGLANIVAGYDAYMETALVDIQTLVAQMFADPTSYGLDEEYVNPPTACLEGSYPSQGVPRSLCDDPARHFFFDIYHPTTGVHDRFAELFVDVLAQSSHV